MLFIMLHYTKLDVHANYVNRIELAKCKVLLIETVRICSYPALNYSNCLVYRKLFSILGEQWQGNCDALKR